jgi:CHAD domain-containing protein
VKADPDSVHDTRTTIRRTQALLDLLPKNIRRKKKMEIFLSRTKSLFKATSQVRDIDIVVAKLKQFEATTPGLQEFFSNQVERRKKLLSAALRFAKLLEKNAFPQIKPRQISDSKFSKREKKVMRRLRDSLGGGLKIITGNPTPEQLHDFRKSCKMLRYTLEIDSKETSKTIKVLANLQKILGSLLDNLTTLKLLSESSLGEAVAAIEQKLRAENETANADLVQTLKSKSMAAIVPSVV